MINLSENNLILVVIFLLLFIILLLSRRSNNRCVTENMNTEFHKQFDHSNKILCPTNNKEEISGHNDGSILNKESITNPKKVINEVASDVEKSTDETHSAIDEVNKVAKEDENNKINDIMKIVNEMKGPTKQNLLKQILIDSPPPKTEKENREHIAKLLARKEKSIPKEEQIKNIASEVKQIISEKVDSEKVTPTKTEDAPLAKTEDAPLAKIEDATISKTEDATPIKTNETAKILMNAPVVRERPSKVLPIENDINASPIEKLKIPEKDLKCQNEYVQINTSAPEVIDQPVEKNNIFESKDDIIDVPSPYNNSFLIGHSLGGLDDGNIKSIVNSPDPKCNIYRDAVQKLNLTGYIKNNQLNNSWNDSFGANCGSM